MDAGIAGSSFTHYAVLFIILSNAAVNIFLLGKIIGFTINNDCVQLPSLFAHKALASIPTARKRPWLEQGFGPKVETTLEMLHSVMECLHRLPASLLI